MDPANRREALREIALDVEEGADIVMVKPALPYLDVVFAAARAHTSLPVAAYQVSGEYSMIKAAGKAGWLRRIAGHAGIASSHQAGRCRPHCDLLRQGRGALSQLTMTFTVTRGLGDVRSRPHPVVAIGNFDGHRRGHHSLLQTVVARAREVGGTAMVVAFDPHPVRVLAPHVELKFLTNPEEKLERFMAAGVDEVVFLEFTPALAAMTPDEFADIVLRRVWG